MAKKISGIYRIVCVKNERYYYGSSMNVRARWEYHKRKLRRQTHTNPVVQRVWNKHGEQSFHIEFVEKVDSDKLLEAEQHYLNEHVGKSKCMNISKDASAPSGGRASPKRGKKDSLETRKRKSRAHKGKPKLWLRGRKFPKMSESRRGKKLSLEHRENIKMGSKKSWDDLEVRTKRIDGMKLSWSDSNR
ncbi:hypothetical protein LCGC14_2592560, partial [marine sediment metagenome]